MFTLAPPAAEKGAKGLQNSLKGYGNLKGPTSLGKSYKKWHRVPQTSWQYFRTKLPKFTIYADDPYIYITYSLLNE